MADVEQRILEMKLDSSDLERNAESSIKTIQKLNSAMKFDDATKGFADLDKSIKNVNLDSLNKSIKGIDFNPLNASLQASANYLVSFGTTFKRVMYEEISRPIAQLPMKVANFAVKPLKLLGAAFDTIATKGKARATNIDQANFMLEGLGANIEEVGEAVSASVNGTAFGYDEAAKVASSFYATGIEDAKQMEEYLKGVVGVAAMTNSDLGSIGHIFTTIAGQGKVTREQLNQFAVKGLNVSADLAKELGKSEEEISKMISKGMIDFDTFATIMNKRYAEHAFKANETYEGSLANMKSALGRIGADFFAPMRDMMIPIFNRLKDIFNNIKQTMKDKGIYDGFTRLTENVTKLFTTIFGAPDSTDFWFLGWVDTLAEKASQAIDFVNGLIESAIGFFEPILGVGKEASEVAETVQDIDAMANRVIAGEFGNDQERFDQLEKLGYNYKIVQNRVNELLGCSYRYEVTEEEMAAATEKNAEAQEKQATFMSKATEAQAKLQETAKGVVKQTRDYIKTIDKKSVFQKFQTALTGIGSLFSMVGSTVGAIVKGAWGGLLEAFKTIGGWILNAAAALGEWITKLETWMKENKVFESMQNGINKAMTKFNGALKTVGKVGGTAFDVLKAGGSKVSTLFTQAKTNASAFWEEFKQTSAYQRLSDIIEGIKQKFIELKDAGIQKVLDLIERFKGTEVKLPTLDADSFAKSVSDKINWILDHISKLKESIKGIFKGGEGGFGQGTVGASIKGFFESTSFQDGLSTVTDLLGKAKDAIVEFFKIFGENASTQISDTGEAFGNFATAAKGFGGDLVSGGKAKLDEFMAWLKEMSPTFKEVGKWIQIAVTNFTAFKAIKSFWNLLDWAKKGGEVLDSVKGTVDSVKGVIESFGGIFKSVSSSIQTLTTSLTDIGTAYKKNLKATALLKTAVAVGIFAAALWALGQLSWDQLKVAAAGIAVITGAIALLLGVLGSFGVLGGGSGSIKGAYADQLGEFLMGIKDGVNKFLKKAGSAMMFGAFAAAIAVLAHTLKSIGDMKWEQIAKGLAGILGCMMVLMAAMAIMAGITKVMGKDKFSGKQALIMLSLAATIMLVGMSVKRLGKLGKGQLTKGLVAVTVIAFVLGAMMELSKNTKDAKLGPILAMTLAIGTIALAVVALSLLPTDKLAAVTTVMTILMGAFALMMAASGQMKGGGAGMIAGIVLMGLVLGEIAAILYLFTSDPNLDPDKMLKISGAISVLMIVFGAITKLCQYIGSAGVSGVISAAAGALEIAGITGLIFLLAEIIGEFTSDIFTEEQIEKAEKGIHLIGRIFTALSSELGNVVGAFFGGLVGGALTGLTQGLPEVGRKLSEFVSNLGSLAEGDGPSFAGFKNLMGFLQDLVEMSDKNTMDNLINNFLGKGDSSLISFGEDLNVFAVLMGMYSDKIQGVDEETITKTSQAISTVTKYANDAPEVGGLMDLFTGDSSLITFGKEAVAFAVYMVAYSNEISGMNADSVTMTSAAIGTVMQFANAAPTVHGSESLLGQIIGSNDLADLGASLITFAKGMVGYSWIVSQLNSIAVENSQKSVEIITALAKNIPGIRMENSIAGQIFGSNTFGALGSGLESFGRAMVAYSQIVGSKKFDTNAIENSKTSAGIITELARNVPNIHGKDTILSWFTGDNSLETLGTNITSFGESMVKFSETLGKIENMGDVEIMLDRLKNLVSLFGMFSDELVNYNTLNTREAVGNLEGEIEGMFEYFHDMWGDEYHVETLKADGAALWESVIEGFKDAAANKVTITDTMTSIFAAEDSVSKLKETGGNLATELINGLRLMIETDTLINTDVLTLVDTIITNVTTFITMRVKDFVAAVDLIKGNVLATIERTRYLLETKAKVLIDVALGKIDSSRDSFVHSVETIANNCVNAVGDYEDDFRNAGVNLIAGFEDGIASMARRAADAAAYVAISAYNAMTRVLEIHSPSKKGQYVGEMLDDGVSKGISDNEKLVSKSATSVGKSAVKSIKNQVLDARKEIFKTAKKTGKGIGTVVQNDLWLDDKTIKKTADKVNKVISNVDTKTSNTNPVITPILDTTKLKNGSKYVDDVLSDGTDTTYSANFTGSIDLTAITSSINQSSNTLGAKIDLTNQKISNLNNTLDSFNGPQNAVFLSLMYEMMGIYFPQFATLPEEDQETILSSQQMSARMAMLAKRAR